MRTDRVATVLCLYLGFGPVIPSDDAVAFELKVADEGVVGAGRAFEQKK
jgi:hypothetical protein